ncbi:MAG: cytosolic protein [Gammaproteobacteria bacterium]|nr:cytosolic protein [Gammaproteobacteria bacterium]
MKAAMIFTGSGPIVVLTSHDSLTDVSLIEKFNAKGITKFIAYEIPVELAEERYGGHYKVVVNDLHESDDLRVLDFNGNRAFGLFKISELGNPITFEG